MLINDGRDVDTKVYENYAARMVEGAEMRLERMRIEYAFTLEVGARVASCFDLQNW